MNSKQTLAVFSAATDSEHKISSNTTQKRTNGIWCQFSMLGQEPTFKGESQILREAVKAKAEL